LRRYCFFPVVFVIAAIIAAVQLANPAPSDAEQLNIFTGMQQLVEYIKSNKEMAQYRYNLGGLKSEMAVQMDAASGSIRTTAADNAESLPALKAPVEQNAKSADSFSSTNIQVEGVDEGDILKSDGKHLYVASGGLVHIIDAYPAGSSKILSSIKCDGYPQEIYLKGDRLLVLSRRAMKEGMIAAVYDITDRSKPTSVRSLAWEGSYVSSRLIGNHAYLVINMPVNLVGGMQGDGETVTLPKITENGKDRVIPPDQIYYFDYPDYNYRYTVIVSVDILDEGKESLCRTFLTGRSQNIYSSEENLYLTGPKSPDTVQFTNRFINDLASLAGGETSVKIKGLAASNTPPGQKLAEVESILEAYLGGLGDSEAAVLEERIYSLREKMSRDMERERNKTVIHRLAVKDGDIDYRCRGEVNGRLLNQFSMDEYGGYFRVATTSEGRIFFDSPVSRNNIYVLDGDLNVVGRLEGLAPRERIYSARFMGSRVYLVTFRNIDPLFVIDLKNPKEPKVLGELKIPGYSDYLHPYDENHLIGVGKEVAPINEPQPVPMREGMGVTAPDIMPSLPLRQQGVKIALFDVTNPARPVELAKYQVEQQGSDSEVSRDHKAFLFSRDKNLMALPVSYSRTFPSGLERGLMPYYRNWQGMYVFNISTAEGISLKGKIEHNATYKSDYEATEAIRRSAYINEIFYTVSEGAVKLSSMADLKEIKTIKLPRDTDDQMYRVEMID